MFNGKLDGEYSMYNEQGQLMTKCYYKDGQLHGTKIDYNISIFEYDTLIKYPKYITKYENGIQIC